MGKTKNRTIRKTAKASPARRRAAREAATVTIPMKSAHGKRRRV